MSYYLLVIDIPMLKKTVMRNKFVGGNELLRRQVDGLSGQLETFQSFNQQRCEHRLDMIVRVAFLHMIAFFYLESGRVLIWT